jgi:hypothetical protein
MSYNSGAGLRSLFGINVIWNKTKNSF